MGRKARMSHVCQWPVPRWPLQPTPSQRPVQEAGLLKKCTWGGCAHPESRPAGWTFPQTWGQRPPPRAPSREQSSSVTPGALAGLALAADRPSPHQDPEGRPPGAFLKTLPCLRAVPVPCLGGGQGPHGQGAGTPSWPHRGSVAELRRKPGLPALSRAVSTPSAPFPTRVPAGFSATLAVPKQKPV